MGSLCCLLIGHDAMLNRLEGGGEGLKGRWTGGGKEVLSDARTNVADVIGDSISRALPRSTRAIFDTQAF